MHRLLRENVPIAEIARRLGRSRQTIYNWKNAKQGNEEKRRRASKLDSFMAYVESRLEAYDLPATTLLRELVALGYSGGITILREVVARLKQRHVQRVVDRFETEPGRQAQVDWASCGTILHHGQRRRLSLLVVVLGYSRTIWARFVISERQPVLMALLEQAFRELGGVPRELVFDNLKQVVAAVRSADRPAVVQRTFAAFAEHWGFEVVPCPPYWPRAKGKVERAVGYLKTSFLEGRQFDTLEGLNAQLATWLAEVANVRTHGTTGQRPVDRLEADRQAMLPVDGTRAFPAMEVFTRQADHDARLPFRGVSYSVDPSILSARRGESVEVRVGADERLRFYHGDRLVGEHVIMPPGSPPQDDPEHARLRRLLRQKAPSRKPPSHQPRFEQRVDADSCLTLLAASAPLVAQRSLAVYEVAP
jgi:transposase